MDMRKREKRVRRTNNFLSFIAILVCATSLVVTGYFFLGHEDSKVQRWITNIESKFSDETPQDVVAGDE